ncbi:MAG: flagellar basal-body rod protein FlgG [Proteobacteria bacterium]|nr:flagellar basal-body rod protein FlgG [Pseudomonadota bacterium]
MIRGLWTAATGMSAQQLNIDTVANNLANVNTAGFKKSRSNFEDLMYQTLLIAGATTPGGGQIPTGIQAGMGVKPTSVQKIFTQGDYVQTGNDLDMAIQGDGFFKVLHGDTELYTRAGNFTLDSEGFITSSNGDRLQPEISIPEGTILVTLQSNGRLSAHGQDATTLLEADIPIYTFVNPAGLFAMGQNLLRPTAGSGDAIEGTPGVDGVGALANQTLEMSNVDIVEEMVSMIVGQRAYEANSKALTTGDRMLETATGLKR